MSDVRPTEKPRGDLRGFRRYFREDFVSGLLVFLIALPLCLGIAIASGYPPIAGIFTAIVGAVVTTFLSNSELTIKGPAAGLIVIAVGCIEDFGGDGTIGGWSEADTAAYRAALAVGVAAAVLQILFGAIRAGILGEFFPLAVVHGMLAAIGVIIIIKQVPIALGVTGAEGEPFEMAAEIPHYLMQANPAVAAIGLASLGLLVLWPPLANRIPRLRPIPAPLVVLLVAIPLGMILGLREEGSYRWLGREYPLGDRYLVDMPDRVFGMFDDIEFPEFSALALPKAWKWVAMFFIIGTLESLLSAKAIDLLDPWKRKTNLDRDLAAIGTANLGASAIGGLPMISEIVRSKANIDNGGKTRFANFWHGILLLGCVALIPFVLDRIPLAALAAMLVVTGFRLAHPAEFLHMWRIGREQFAIFVATMLACIATDLLIGVAVGIVLKLLIHRFHGAGFAGMFRPSLVVDETDRETTRVVVRQAAVFSNWIAIKRRLEEVGLRRGRHVIVDVSTARLVDHSVMAKFEEVQRDFAERGLRFDLQGVEALRPLSPHPRAARVGSPRHPDQ